MSQSPPAWHPDPSDPNSLRWWDGERWTEHTHPLVPQTAPQPDVTPPAGSGPIGVPPGYGQASGGNRPPGGGQPYSGGGQPYSGGDQPYGAQQPFPGYGQPFRQRGGYFRGANSFSFTAMATAAAYVLLAVTTHFVLIGIVPVMSAVRAFQRGEKLAPLAALAAAVAVGTFIVFLHHR